MDQMYCDLCSGVGLRRLADGWAVRGKEGGEIKEGSLVQGCHNLGGRGRAGGRGCNEELHSGPAEHREAGELCSQPQAGKGGSLPHSP